MGKKPAVALFLLIAISFTLVSCSFIGSSNTQRVDFTGTDGITIAFADGAPQPRYTVSEYEEPISVMVEIRNEGSWPQDEKENILAKGRVYISGFDRNIIYFNEHFKNLNKDFLEGFGYVNPDGGFDLAEFKGGINVDDLVIDTYAPTILATACFPYVTKASPSVCIDPQPFDTGQAKVCEIGSTSLTSQGAPVAVKLIEQEASSTKVTFKIRIENVGGGDIIKHSSIDNCNPYGKSVLTRNDFDKVELKRASIGFTELNCGPFVEGRSIRLYQGSGFIICSMEATEYESISSAYTTPLNIELLYGYRIIEAMPISIQKVTTII